MSVIGYVLRSQETTHVGTHIQRVEEVHDTGRRIDKVRIVRVDDVTRYVLARTIREAGKKVIAGGLEKPKPPLTWLPETETRRMFALEGSTR